MLFQNISNIFQEWDVSIFEAMNKGFGLNLDCLGTGTSIFPQLCSDYALPSNLGHCGGDWAFC